MTGLARFYKTVGIAENDGRYHVRLDGKPIKTPHRATLALPSRALAEAVAGEWRAQGEKIDLENMPLTRLANVAAELAPEHRAEAAARILAFGKSDHLCYRADTSAELARRQAVAWDPLLDWAATALGAPLATGEGIAFVEQSPGTLAALEKAILAHEAYGLTALHSAAAITGSLVLALALAKGRLGARKAFELSRLDEAFQAEKWGRDAAAEKRAERLAAELEAAERFMRLAAA